MPMHALAVCRLFVLVGGACDLINTDTKEVVMRECISRELKRMLRNHSDFNIDEDFSKLNRYCARTEFLLDIVYLCGFSLNSYCMIEFASFLGLGLKSIRGEVSILRRP